MKRLIKSFLHAFDGLKSAFSTQTNFRIHTFVAMAVIIAGIVFRLSYMEWAIIIISIGTVIGAECINTAIESAVDLCTYEYNEKAKIAKDCAAAGVLTVSIMSAVTGIIIFSNKLSDLFL